MKIQVLLVHNKFSFTRPLTWFSLLIRIFTCSKWNHVAIRIGDNVIESKGDGVTLKTYEEWFVHSNRIVLPRIPKESTMLAVESVLMCKGLTYGFLDVWERFLRIKHIKWDGKDPSTFVFKNHKGLICSDLACILLGLPEIYMPSELEYYDGLINGEEFITYKS